MAEKQKLTGTLTGLEVKGNRTALTFLVNGAEIQVSAFQPPSLPNLKEGEDYRFEIYENKGYLNLSPLWKGRDKVGYDIHLAGEDEYFPPEPKNSHAKIDAIKPADSRENYWKNREEAEAKQRPIFTRLSCLSTAGEMVSIINSEGTDAAIRETIKIAKALEHYANTGE